MTLSFSSTKRALLATLVLALLGGQVATAQTATTNEDPPPDAAADSAAAGATADASAEGSTTEDPAAGSASADATAPPADSASDQSTDVSANTQATTDAQPQDDAQAQADASAATPAQPTPQGDAAQGQADVQAGVQGQAEQGQPGIEGQANVQGQAQLPGAGQTQPGAQTQTNVNLQSNVNQTQNFGLQFGQATARGLTLNAIDRGSVFFNAGLQPRDVLVSVSGRPIRSIVDFQRFVALYPGQRIPLVVLRGGQQQTIFITPPASHSIAQQPPAVGLPAQGGVIEEARLGVKFDAQIPNAAVVRSVNPGSPAERAGLQAGDTINALNGQQVVSAQHVSQMVSQIQPAQQVQIDYSRRHSAATTLAASPAPHAVGYAPQPLPQSAPVTVEGTAPRITFDNDDVIRQPQNGTVVRPGDADRDGRVLDGDGRIGRNRR
jgi:S1-C subfamily serine protease